MDGPEGGHAQAALAASIFHFHETTVAEVKLQLLEWGIAVRPPAGAKSPEGSDSHQR
jgi:cyclase